jgi:transposase
MEHGRSSPDLDELLGRVDELLRCNRELTAVVEEQQATIAAQQDALQRAAEQLTLLKKALFAPRRERYVPSPDQGLLFGEQRLDPPPVPPEELPCQVAPRKPKRPRTKFVFPQGLPVERIEHPLPEAERPCGCCGCERVVIDELVSKQLELEGPKARIVEHVRYTYACSKCRSGSQVVTTTKPTAPIEKSPFGASVLAWITAAKFERHMPLYREQEMLLKPLGMWLSRPLLCNLLKGTARALKPLAVQLLAEILKSCVVQADETPVRFLPGEAGKSRLGYLSGYAGDEEHRFLWYDFRPSRSRDGPQAVLAGYHGVLLTDGYSVYESLVNNSAGRLKAAACWMHARRGFDEARYTTSHALVEETLVRIRMLYDIEDRGKQLSRANRGALRASESRPVVERIFARLEEVRPELRPSTKLAEAIGYVLHRKEALSRFLDDGRIPLDTGLLERSLRPAAVGRRNWLFFGSFSGGQTAATLYSVVQSARGYQLDVTTYLTDMLRRLPALPPNDTEGLRKLLPDRWAKTHPEHVLEARQEESRAAQDLRRQRRAARRLAQNA